ncbi:DUF4105 domain-containing protein [Tamlana fucoidanivorans]|uniref:lipoprotein N-acyltransferase Lnb domain-containing protein n=1 Tax=Allotamlana fucoidanivorans TaxID=2583814 RepID=UPI001E4A101D|nr:DUF4105 domain-containing protein [Tamlana fucoidanivorans]
MCFTSYAQDIILSEQAKISVLTIAPGTSLNDAFGHNAFRIQDPSINLDKTYDYGRFDFEAPNFYLNFAKGKLNYALGQSNFYDFLRFYIYQNRTVEEQVLNLSQSEKQQLYDFLINNYKPENRNYLYDFFFDNCATKIKDVVNHTLNNQIHFETPDTFENASFRALIQNNLNRNSWGSLGIDIALGSVIDKTAPAEDHMFLPKNIYSFFNKATLKTTNQALVKQSSVLYKQKDTTKSSAFFTSPLFILGIVSLLIIFVTYKDYRNQSQSKWLDIALFAITGIIGVLLLLLWFATNHTGTHQNYNLLWAFALNLVVIGQLYKTKVSAWFIRYIKLLVILLCLLTLHWIIGVQVFAIGLIPLMMALFIRYIYLVYHYTH